MSVRRDPRPLYSAAVAWVHELMAGIREDQLDAPTPCAAFDLRMLLGHLVGTAERSLATAQGRPTVLIPHVVVDIANGDLATRYVTVAAAAVSAWSALHCLDDPVVAPWGEVTGRSASWGFTNETLVHGWDIAVAAGQPAKATAGLIEPVLARAHRLVPEATRNTRAYSPVLTPRPSAGPTERLANWHGHQWPAARPDARP